MKRPAFQFYPADWRTDNQLQSCSIAARGLWHELLCVMHDCNPYGHLVLESGLPMDDAKAARLLGVELKEYRKLLVELDSVGVFSRTDNGAIYSRRMVKDEVLREVRANGGSKGADHGSRGADFGKLGGRPRLVTGDKKPPSPDENKPPLKPPPSSSSSSSSSNGLDVSTVMAQPTTKPSIDKIPSKTAPNHWSKSDQGTDVQARKLGIAPKQRESYDQLRQRIWQHMFANSIADSG